jgi:hypothetical protein
VAAVFEAVVNWPLVKEGPAVDGAKFQQKISEYIKALTVFNRSDRSHTNAMSE